MAGCAWCQLAIPVNWWSPITREHDLLPRHIFHYLPFPSFITQLLIWLVEWAGNCTTVQFNPNGISPTLVTTNIVIPQWALAIPTGTQRFRCLHLAALLTL